VGEELGQVGVVLHLLANDLADHGVLAHQDDGVTTERDTDLLHLVRADIVDVDNEELGVALEQVLKLLEVIRLAAASVSL
jgi:hypothetical protein